MWMRPADAAAYGLRVARQAGKFGAHVAGEPSRLLEPNSRPGWSKSRQFFGGLSGAELVRSRIALEVRLGDLSPGDRLIDAGVISAALGVSEITVRRALETMGQDGLLERRRGRAGGTFIAARWDAVALSMRHDEQAAQLVDFQRVLESGLAALACGELDLDDLAALSEHVPSAESDQDPDSYALAEAHFHLALATVLGGWRARERQSDLLGKLCLLLPKPPVGVARQQNRAHAQLLMGLQSRSIDVAVEAVKLHARCWPLTGGS
jgi:DNA-binding GntR family transcriptional regulator